MLNSRKIEDLHPKVQAMCKDFIKRCKSQGIDVVVYSTYRDHEAQDDLYAQGRSKPGRRVTNARGGQSFHNWRVAFDVVPLRKGGPVWGTVYPDDITLWEKVGRCGEDAGLEWGGRWKMVDMPHFQYTGGLKLADFQKGKTLE